jgi:hypothetical protein
VLSFSILLRDRTRARTRKEDGGAREEIEKATEREWRERGKEGGGKGRKGGKEWERRGEGEGEGDSGPFQRKSGSF